MESTNPTLTLRADLVHQQHRLKEVVSLANQLDNDMVILSKDKQLLPCNKSLLALFSPVIARLMSGVPCCSSPTIFLPDFPALPIRKLLHLLRSGQAIPGENVKVDIRMINRITEVLQISMVDLNLGPYIENPLEVPFEIKKELNSFTVKEEITSFKEEKKDEVFHVKQEKESYNEKVELMSVEQEEIAEQCEYIEEDETEEVLKPADGEQPPPLAFYGPTKTLKELEKAYGTGVQLHSRLHAGNSANSASHLAARWTGGTPEASSSSTSQGPSLPADFRIPKVEPGVRLVKHGQVSYDRLKMADTTMSKAAYTASDEIMKCFTDLVAMGKKTLEKRTKEFTAEHLKLPPRQYNEVRVPTCPEGMDRLARVDGASKGKEHGLMAVGNALNHVFLAAIKMFEPVIGLYDHLPNLEILISELVSALPPLYASPADVKTPEEVTSGMRGDQQLFVDPEAGSSSDQHWLRRKGEAFLESSAVLRDIFVKAVPDRTEDDGPDVVTRDEYLEVCWRLAMLREFSKKVQTHNEELAYKIGRVSHAVSALVPELRSVQDTFSGALFPAMGYTRATLMFQRFDHYRNVLTTDFRRFLKQKSANELLPDGTEKPMMQWFVEDPVGIGEEFSDFMAKKPKDRELFRTKSSGGGGGGSGDAGGSGYRNNNNNASGKDAGRRRRKGKGSGSSNNNRVRSPTRFLEGRDRSRQDRRNDDDADRSDRKRWRSRDDRDESPRRKKDKKDDKKSGGAGKGKGKKSKGGNGKGKGRRDRSSDRD